MEITLLRPRYIIETHTVCYSNSFYLEGIDVFIESAKEVIKNQCVVYAKYLFLLTLYRYIRHGSKNFLHTNPLGLTYYFDVINNTVLLICSTLRILTMPTFLTVLILLVNS